MLTYDTIAITNFWTQNWPKLNERFQQQSYLKPAWIITIIASYFVEVSFLWCLYI